ncbi:MAG: hypothetical protein WDW36_000420 [Sanguina aurantia]
MHSNTHGSPGGSNGKQRNEPPLPSCIRHTQEMSGLRVGVNDTAVAAGRAKTGSLSNRDTLQAVGSVPEAAGDARRKDVVAPSGAAAVASAAATAAAAAVTATAAAAAATAADAAADAAAAACKQGRCAPRSPRRRPASTAPPGCCKLLKPVSLDSLEQAFLDSPDTPPPQHCAVAGSLLLLSNRLHACALPQTAAAPALPLAHTELLSSGTTRHPRPPPSPWLCAAAMGLRPVRHGAAGGSGGTSGAGAATGGFLGAFVDTDCWGHVHEPRSEGLHTGLTGPAQAHAYVPQVGGLLLPTLRQYQQQQEQSWGVRKWGRVRYHWWGWLCCDGRDSHTHGGDSHTAHRHRTPTRAAESSDRPPEPGKDRSSGGGGSVHTRSGGQAHAPAWAGAGLPSVALDLLNGRLTFIVARLTDGLAGGCKTVLRARHRASATQVLFDLGVEVERSAFSNRLPAQTAVRFLAEGTLECSNHRIWVCCHSLAASTGQEGGQRMPEQTHTCPAMYAANPYAQDSSDGIIAPHHTAAFTACGSAAGAADSIKRSGFCGAASELHLGFTLENVLAADVLQCDRLTTKSHAGWSSSSPFAATAVAPLRAAAAATSSVAATATRPADIARCSSAKGGVSLGFSEGPTPPVPVSSAATVNEFRRRSTYVASGCKELRSAEDVCVLTARMLMDALPYHYQICRSEPLLVAGAVTHPVRSSSWGGTGWSKHL